MKKNIKIFLILALLLAYYGCGPEKYYTPHSYIVFDDFTHKYSGIHFPVRIGSFIRDKITHYDAKGKDIGVAYNITEPDFLAAATVYVYPAPPVISIGSPKNMVDNLKKKIFTQHLEEVKYIIIKEHPGAKLISQENIVINKNRKLYTVVFAHYQYSQIFARREQAVFSDLYLYQDNEWFIKHRVTYPVSQKEFVNSEILPLLERIQ